jgi:spore germination protein GerM
MKRLMTVLATAALLAACAEGAKSGGPVATGDRPTVSGPSEPTTAPPTTVPTTEPTATTAPSSGPSPVSPPPNSPTPGSVTLEVWFDSSRDSRLTRVFRTVPATQAVGTAALEALLDGPSGSEVAKRIGTQVPPGTALMGLSIADGVATVNLSNDYFSGGSAVSEWTRLGQVVWTITQFPTVRGVTIELAGDPIKPFDIDGKALGRPWNRADFEQIAPAIVVDSPVAGEAVSSPIHVTGTADVFEATVSLRLLDEHGEVITTGFTTATCGTGCRGTFEKSLPYSVDHSQPGTLQVYEASAKDGSPINVVSIPVALTA